MSISAKQLNETFTRSFIFIQNKKLFSFEWLRIRPSVTLSNTDLLDATEIWERSYIHVVCGNKVLSSRHTYQKRRVVNLYTLDDKKCAMGLKVTSPWPVHHSVKPIPYTTIVAFKRGRQAVRRERKLERKVVISGLKLYVTSVLKRTLRKTTIN